MIDDGGDEGQGSILAGFTYFGQFIDHDLTLDITPLSSAHPNVGNILNGRSPFLNLDHIYSGGPNVAPFLYDIGYPPGKERFLIGQTNGADPTKGRQEDLPRNSQGIGLTADPRQDENLILAQLHVAFLKLHNAVMDDPVLLKPFQDQGSDFAAAQRLITWLYQYLVLEEYLPTVVDEDIAESVRAEWKESGPADVEFRIPIEFSGAAFRFGHSMVRDSYPLFNDAHPDAKDTGVDLTCLLALTGAGYGRVPCDQVCVDTKSHFKLPDDWVIGWQHFFRMSTSGMQVNQARKIDTAIAKTLHHLDEGTIRHFNASVAEKRPDDQSDNSEPRLPVRTLLRGARMGLPTGQAVADALATHALTQSEIAPDGGPHTAILRDHGFHRDTPLWYYILKEAELPRIADGNSLGPVGSRIVAEVLIGAVRSDPKSYLSCDPQWSPPDLGGQHVYGIGDILDFVSPKSA
jgi:hypothetical protein